MRKRISNYLTDILTIASNPKHTEPSYYESVNKLFREYFSKRKFKIEANISDIKGNPDITISHLLAGTKIFNPIIKIEVKDFVKWDKGSGMWRKIDVEKMIAEPDSSSDAKHLREQIYKYNIDSSFVVVTDLCHYWIVDPSIKVTNPKTDGYTPVPIFGKYTILNWDKKTPSSLEVIPSADDLMIHLKTILLVHLPEYEIISADSLQEMLLLYIKSDPYNLNLHDEIGRILSKPIRSELSYRKFLQEIKADFSKSLFRDVAEDAQIDFVDLYTQMLTFILFMAWSKYSLTPKSTTKFIFRNIVDFLPSNSLLRELIKEYRIPKHIKESIIKPIERIFQHSNYQKVMADVKHVYGTFYSDFLEKYDKNLARRLGIVNTPDEIISFIVNGVDYFLGSIEWKINGNHRPIRKGILDKRVSFLDPAGGTMGFTVAMIRLASLKIGQNVRGKSKYSGLSEQDLNTIIHQTFNNWIFEKIPPPSFLKNDEIDDYLLEQPLFLENVYAFEILMSPYVLGYMRILMEAELLGATIDYTRHYPQLFLTNTLMNPPEDLQLQEGTGAINWSYIKSRQEFAKTLGLGLPSIRNEVEKSLRIRHDGEIMVIWGNPPYRNSSQNKTNWIENLTNDYIKQEYLIRERGKPTSKPITNIRIMKADEIKFHRFAQWKITENNNQGLVAYVSNGSYIKEPGGRGMRKVLRTIYDEIWIVNLYGNFRTGVPKRLRDSGIVVDENVFGNACSLNIAISFMIRYSEDKHEDDNCKIMYTECAGDLEKKMKWLGEHSVESLMKTEKWVQIGDRLDHEFTPDYYEENVDYDSFPDVSIIFKDHIQGVNTGHDYWISDISEDTLNDRMKTFFNEKVLPLDKEKYSNALKKIRNYKEGASGKQKYLWRPFNIKTIFYHPYLLHRHYYRILRYVFSSQENLALIINRGMISRNLNSFFVTRYLTHNKVLEGSRGLNSYVFPLKIGENSHIDLKKSSIKKGLLKTPDPLSRSNIKIEFSKLLPYKLENSNDIFYYIYGIFYTQSYSEYFHEKLVLNFPRIPFPCNKTIFTKVANFGKRLVKLHLNLTSDDLDQFKKESPIYLLLNQNIQNDLKLVDSSINTLADSDSKRRIIIPFYDEKKERIYFDKPNDKTEVFWIGKVPKDVWNFDIGGRNPLQDWISERIFTMKDSFELNQKSRGKFKYINHPIRQNPDELEWLRLTISAIKNTIIIKKELDLLFPSVLKDIYNFDMNKLNILAQYGKKKEPSKLSKFIEKPSKE